MAQVAIGLVNGAFYAMLSLGLAVIFGMLNVINFTHGAQFMMGAFAAWLLLGLLDVPFWASLLLAPLIVGLFGVIIERLLLKRIYHLDHLYGFLLTFGMALIIEGLFQWKWGSSGAPYPAPITGATDLGFMVMPNYRLFVVVAALVVCLATWYGIERTKLEASLKPRRLTAEQKVKLTSLLTPFSTLPITLEWVAFGTDDVPDLASDMLDAINNAGITIPKKNILMGEYFRGVQIKFGNDRRAEAEIVAGFLIEAGLSSAPVPARPEPNAQHLAILIGSKP